jgi:Mlc titration factor MtfA (ptsG expression regulator)
MAAGLLVAAAGLVVLTWLLAVPWLRNQRRRRLEALPLDERLRRAIERNVPLVRRLPSDARSRLEGLVNAFLADKRFVGCNGLVMTDEVRATIAAQASLLLLGRPRSRYAALREILVYPTPFWVDEDIQDDDGLVTRRRHMLSGQSWDSSRIIVSWQDVMETVQWPGEGYNVVLHEFAHYFDAEGEPCAEPTARDGGGRGDRAESNERIQRGRPGDGESGSSGPESWRERLSAEFDRLAHQVDDGEETFLDPYGAEDEAEFFAVATEEFLERPAEFERAEPHLYRLLRQYYGIDPASWSSA